MPHGVDTNIIQRKLKLQSLSPFRMLPMEPGLSWERIAEELANVDEFTEEAFDDPTRPYFLHALWLNSLQSYDPDSCTFDEQELRDQAQWAVKERERIFHFLGADELLKYLDEVPDRYKTKMPKVVSDWYVNEKGRVYYEWLIRFKRMGRQKTRNILASRSASTPAPEPKAADQGGNVVPYRKTP